MGGDVFIIPMLCMLLGACLDGGYLVASIFLTLIFFPVFWLHLAMTVVIHEITKSQIKTDRTTDISGNLT